MELIAFDVMVPVQGYVRCGTPEMPFDDLAASEREPFYRLAGLHPRLTYTFLIKGDSMVDAGLHENDLVFVDCSREPSDGDIVLVRLNGEQTIKRLRIRAKSWVARVELVSENKRYQPIVIGEGDEFDVLGVVGGHFRVMHRGR